MMVRKFLAWTSTASSAERASAAAGLARALLAGDLPADEEGEASMALAALADDPSPLVRLALAGELAARADAPRHIIIALAADQSEISAPVLRLSPLLTDADLVDAAAIGDPLAQTAIALRDAVSAPVCAALVEVGVRDSLVALMGNSGAAIPRGALARIVERSGEDPQVREALLARADLSPALRARLVEAAAKALQEFVLARGWMSAERAERATREAREKGFVLIAADAADEEARGAIARCLRGAARLTPALLLRSLLSGERTLLESALAELTGIPPQRTAGCIANYPGAAFAALYCRSGLPESLLPVFRFALAALAQATAPDELADGGLQRALVERVLADCERADLAQAQPVLGLLRRFQVEAARQEAREFSAWVARGDAMAAFKRPLAESLPAPEEAPKGPAEDGEEAPGAPGMDHLRADPELRAAA